MNAPGPGHNTGQQLAVQTTDLDLLATLLQTSARLLTDRRDDLLRDEAELPAVESEEAVREVGDYLKLIRSAIKTADGRRVELKEPYLLCGRHVDGFFKGITEPLEALDRRTLSKLDAYQQRKLAAERRARDEEAARQREEARQARLEADQLAAAAAAAETRSPGGTTATRLFENASLELDRAEIADQAAIVAQQAAEAKPADLVRTRGTFGSVVTMQQRWVGEIQDRETLDLEALRPFLKHEDLQRALNAYVKVHQDRKPLRGALIEQRAVSTVR